MPGDPTATPVKDGVVNDDGSPKADEAYLGNYASKEDAEQGLKEKDAAISRLANELDSRKKADESGSQLASVLEKLGNQQPAKPEPIPIDWGKIEKAVEDGDGKVVTALIRDVIASTAGHDDVSNVRAELEEKYGDRLAALEAGYQTVRPEYLQHKETVAEVQKQFPELDADTAIKVATMMDAAKPAAPPADTPPGNMQNSRVTGEDTAPALTPEAIKLLSDSMPGGYREGELEATMQRLTKGNG